MAVAKEQIRQIISQNNLNSVADVYSLLKESFKDILQELMEAELDTISIFRLFVGSLQYTGYVLCYPVFFLSWCLLLSLLERALI